MRSWLLLDLLELHSPCPCSFSTTPLEVLHNSRPNVCGITRDVENNPTSLHQQDTGPAQRGLAMLSLFMIVYNEWQKSLLYPSSTPNLLELFDANTSWRKTGGWKTTYFWVYLSKHFLQDCNFHLFLAVDKICCMCCQASNAVCRSRGRGILLPIASVHCFAKYTLGSMR